MAPQLNKESLIGLTGGDVLCRVLADQSVDHVFGYPGGAALPLFDGIYKTESFRFILSHHEQGAGHMAEGYAVASGKPGVVLVTSGPASSNTVTPMFNALLDGTPIVVICGQVATTVEGTDAFQEIDVMSLAKSCTKWCTCVRNISDLPGLIETAFRWASNGRPGPVLIAIPKDIGMATFDRTSWRESLNAPCDEPVSQVPNQFLLDTLDVQNRIARVADLFNRCQRPVICAGKGVLTSRNGAALLAQLVKKAKIPVATTLLGLGSFDEARSESLHMMGTYGAPYANHAIQNADLILVMGARLDERAVGNATLFAQRAREKARSGDGGIVYFNISAESVGKVVKGTELILGDLSETLSALISRIKPRDYGEWLDQIQEWKRSYQTLEKPIDSEKIGVLPQSIITELDHQTARFKHETTITTGVGQHQMWVSQLYQWRYPRTLITSGGLGTMGFGLPAAIGASLARPGQVVIDVDGDASFCMTMEELLTASQYQVPVKVIILNNQQQAMITQLQKANYGGRVCHVEQQNPEFTQLAQSMGCEGRSCGKLGDLSAHVQWLLQCQGPALLEVVTEEVDMGPVL